jgi:hypothetical protein
VDRSGGFSINGEPLDSQYDNGEVEVRAGETDRARLARTRDRTYSVRLGPGLYHVYYDVMLSNGRAPYNVDARIGCLRGPGDS